MILTNANYDYPLVLAGSFFNGLVPPPPSGPWLYPNYMATYHIHYLRYLYYMCYMGATGPYPVDIELDELLKKLHEKNHNCSKRIKKILIGEAPNIPTTYFYNPATPIVGTSIAAWYTPIATALFPGVVFANRTEFLMACAREGFLLMDLFPYDGPVYPARKIASQKIAYKSAFCGLPLAYPYNIISRLNSILCCLEDKFALAFGLIRFGDVILNDAASVAALDAWLLANGKSLLPPGPTDMLRLPPVAGASDFLRVVGKSNKRGPDATLLIAAGF